MFLVVMPVIVPFYRASGLDIREVYLLQSVFAIGTLLLEVPTGYAADLLRRKKTLVVGSLFYGISFTWLAVASGFRGFMVFELLAAAGVALFSGSCALVREPRPPVRRRCAGARAIGSLLFAAPLGETAAAPQGESAGGGKRTLWPGRLLRLLLANQVLYSTTTLVAVWAFQAYWSEQAIPVLHFGWLWATQNVAVALTARVAHRAEGHASLAVGFAPRPARDCRFLRDGALRGLGRGCMRAGISGLPCGEPGRPAPCHQCASARAHAPHRKLPRRTRDAAALRGGRAAFGHAMDRLGPAGALRLAGLVSLAIALGASLPLVRERALRAV